VTDRIYLGRIADTLADGRPLAFGDEVSLDADAEKANQHLIDAGVLREKPEPSSDVQELDIQGRSQMKADDLRAAIAAAERNEETPDA
jgi:hypothetical protein